MVTVVARVAGVAKAKVVRIRLTKVAMVMVT